MDSMVFFSDRKSDKQDLFINNDNYIFIYFHQCKAPTWPAV